MQTLCQNIDALPVVVRAVVESPAQTEQEPVSEAEQGRSASKASRKAAAL